VDLEFYSDKSMTDYAAHYYQTLTEGGYYGYNAIPFKKYLHYITVPEPSASVPPRQVSCKSFDGSLMDKINSWLYSNGNNFIYLYGGRDTWSACRVNVSPQVNARLYMIPGANHYTARIKNMPPDMQNDFAGTVRKMLNIDTDLKAIQ
jgi:hypothetical protein